MARREALTGYLFILPTYFGFLLFVLGPVIASLGLSFFDWDLLAQKPPRFVGAQNFANLAEDARLLTAFRNTALFVVGAVGLEVALAVVLAVAVQSVRSRPLTYFLRTAFFLPLTLSGAAVAVILSYLFQQGVRGHQLLHRAARRRADPVADLGTLVAGGGDLRRDVAHRSGSTSSSSWPASRTSRARCTRRPTIDGAGPSAKFWNVTIPLLSPTMLFVDGHRGDRRAPGLRAAVRHDPRRSG